MVLDIGGKRYRKGDRAAERLADSADAAEPRTYRAAGARIEIRYGVSRTGGAHRASRKPDRSVPSRDASGSGPVLHAAAALVRGSRLVPRGARETAPKRCASSIKRTRCCPAFAKQDLRGRELPDSPPFLIDALLAEAEADRRGRRERAAAHAQTGSETRRGASPRRHRARLRASRFSRPRAAGCAGKIRRGIRARPLAAANPAAREAADPRERRSGFPSHRDRKTARTCWPHASPRVSTWARSRSGRASRASMPSRFSNIWTASASRGGKATSAWFCKCREGMSSRIETKC